MAEPLTIEMFGPMRVLIEGEPLPHMRSRKAQWLLAILALRGGKPIARETLASTLWPDTEANTALANLRPLMSELRRAMGNQGHRLVSPDRNSIFLELAGAQVDVVAFDAAARHEATYAQAIERYRGVLLEGCQEEWVHQERNAREQACVLALESVADRCVSAGAYATAVLHYQRAIPLDPWRDSLRRGLMTALDAAGDVNAAVQAYRDYAFLLSREGGTIPEAPTTSLYTRLREKIRDGKVISRPERVGGISSPPCNLPAAPTELVGREDEQADIAASLRQFRLVTLTGVGGIGKSRLALGIAEAVLVEYSGGTCFISFEEVTEGPSVAAVVADAMGVTWAEPQSAVDAIASRIGKDAVLLVLDNCEHLVRPVSQLADRLLRECGQLHILATSRESLGISGEVICPVYALETPDPAQLPRGRQMRLRVAASYDAVVLFTQRAKAAQPDFVLSTENVVDVVRVCAKLEGIPLALELAAARMRSMSASSLVERLEHHPFDLLQSRNRAIVDRQQTMRATFDWSYALLSHFERRVLAWLSVFSSGWTLGAAERALADIQTQEETIAEAVHSLVGKSLASFDANLSRFQFLEMVHLYAATRLAESGEVALAEEAHRKLAY